mmetsp:Transcript_47130/g.105971  ORF Transcript_47130/g.105971 Transcript_47130/m.105971 type:complete len:295 (+) Transcript_47130:238-1122(+)
MAAASGLFVHHLRDGPPAHREEGSLQAVGQDAGAQAAAEEPDIALLLNDLLSRLHVTHWLQCCLPRCLQHPQGVGKGVRNGGRCKANDGIADVLPIGKVKGWQGLPELIVGVEPRVVAHPRRSHGTNGTLPERGGVLLGLLQEPLQAVLALHLLGGLPGINGHEEHAEASSATGGRHGLGRGGQVRVLEGRERAVVGRGVAEPGDGRLDQPWSQTAVEPGDATLRPQLLGDLHEAAAVTVLVVHDGAHPHQRQHVDGLCAHASKASAQSLLRSLGHDLIETWRRLGLLSHCLYR